MDVQIFVNLQQLPAAILAGGVALVSIASLIRLGLEILRTKENERD